jgi:S1-C subfamily serine protease
MRRAFRAERPHPARTNGPPFSRRGWIGVGFAIPSETASRIAAQLIGG